jgi:hypothetical protein
LKPASALTIGAAPGGIRIKRGPSLVISLRFGPERLIEVREHCPAPKRQLGGLLDEG